MKKRTAILLTTGMVGILLAGCGDSKTGDAKGSGSEKSDKVYEIKLTSNDATTTVWMENMQKASDAIREQTDGGVDIQIYGNGEMLVGDAGLEAVMSDAAVFYFADPNNYGDYVPEWNTICAPYLWDNYKTVEAFTQTDSMKKINEKAQGANVHAVGDSFFVVGTRGVMANKPVAAMEDMKKLTLRVPNSTIYTKTFEALGCNYQAMDMSATYNALETGMIDGCENTSGNFVNNKIADSISTPYYSLTNHMVCVVALCCGQGYWDTLPTEYQEIITKEFGKCIAESNETVGNNEEENRKKLEDSGVEIVEIEDLSAFQEAVLPYCETLEGWDEISSEVNNLKE